jgi:hypothetical protein
MNPFTPTIDERYRQYAELLVRHHQLLSEGKEDADETSAVEDDMSELWERLDDRQRSSLSGLGSDLNWLRREGAPPPRARKSEDVTAADLEGLTKASQSLDWHGVLHFLRVCAPKMATLELASARTLAWERAGLPHIGKVFDAFRAELDKSNGWADAVDEARSEMTRE